MKVWDVQSKLYFLVLLLDWRRDIIKEERYLLLGERKSWGGRKVWEGRMRVRMCCMRLGGLGWIETMYLLVSLQLYYAREQMRATQRTRGRVYDDPLLPSPHKAKAASIISSSCTFPFPLTFFPLPLALTVA